MTFTATVSVSAPGTTVNASPTGTVTFYDGAGAIGTGTLGTSGGVTTATFSTSILAVGAHTITAAYTSGDTNFSASPASAAITQTVQKANTMMAVTSSINPTVFGQATIFTATFSVTSPGTTLVAYPTGTVTFYDGTNQLGQPVAVATSGGVTTATLSWAGLSVSAGHTIKAVYGGDGNFTTSAGTITQAVNKDATTTTATASASTDPFGQTLTFTASVAANAPGAGTPTGGVDFYDTATGNDLGSVGLSGGSAALSTAALPAGSQTITVSYGGDGNFLGGTTTVTVSVATSVIVLNPTASGAMSISGNAIISIPGMVVVDSSATTALSASGYAQVTAASIQVVGGFQETGNAILNPTPTTGIKPLADPLAALAVPAGGKSQGSVNLSSGSLTIDPGIYKQISVSGTGSLKLNPGVYVIAGGGLSVSGSSASVAGSGVMIYNAGSNFPKGGGGFGAINLSGKGNIQLSAPATGPYADILVFQSRDNTQTITLSGNGTLAIGGIIYAPAAQLTMSGNSTETQPLVVNQLNMSGNASDKFTAPASPSGASGSAGTLSVVTFAATPSPSRIDQGLMDLDPAPSGFGRRGATSALPSRASRASGTDVNLSFGRRGRGLVIPDGSKYSTLNGRLVDAALVGLDMDIPARLLVKRGRRTRASTRFGSTS